MSTMKIHVAFPSGRGEQLCIPSSSKVGDLRRLAQETFAQGFLKLVTANGEVLSDATQSLEETGLEDGGNLTVLAVEPILAANRSAMALSLQGGDKVVTWGKAENGGDSSAVQGKLKAGVQQIVATNSAFAAVLADGSVVTWGKSDYGGDSSAVQHRLKSVKQLVGNYGSFAALLADGSVVTWPVEDDQGTGGDSSAVQDQLGQNVKQLGATHGAFAAILTDGSVVAWGNPYAGGNIERSIPADRLRNVKQFGESAFAHEAFAAILEDGSVVTWGHEDEGANSEAVQHQLKSVKQVQGTNVAFAALKEDGSVITWGEGSGGDSSAVQDQLKGVQKLWSRGAAFLAMLADGSLVTWGISDEDEGGNFFAVKDQLSKSVVKSVHSSDTAFAVILEDGSVVTWGQATTGGDSSAVQHQLKNVRHIKGGFHALVATTATGQVVTWGDAQTGGDSSEVQEQFLSL